MEPRQQGEPFTAYTGTDGPDIASFTNLMKSFMDGSTHSPPNVQATSTELFTQTSRSAGPVTFSTIPSSASSILSSIASAAASTSTSASIGTSRNTAATTVPSPTNAPLTAGGGLTKSDTCNSISCSPRLQAAVAVPVVVGVVVIIGLVIFLARRKRRASNILTSDSEKPRKEWTRHLRVFSFDNELIHGGRFSSSNSTHSHGSSQRLTENTRQRDDPSLHSIYGAAPPYRDTEHIQHPNMTQTGTGLAVGGLATAIIPRSSSRASAPPPPYGLNENEPPINPTVSVTNAAENPFSDSNQRTPVEGSSPFEDPSEDGRSDRSHPTVSRNSSVRTGPDRDGNSTWYDSDAGSVREAQVGRHVSVTAGGRQINVRNSSQSPPDSD